MVKQFDIITVDLNPTRGKEKNKYRPCVVVSNKLLNRGSAFSWVLPITHRPPRRPSDIPIRTRYGKVGGIIDTVQIRALDLSARHAVVIDKLDQALQDVVLETIQIHTEMLEK